MISEDSNTTLVGGLPIRLGSIRTRLTLLYTILLFGLAAAMVGGIYLSLSQALADEPMSREVRFEGLNLEQGQISSEFTVSVQLASFEQEVNQRALGRLRTYSFVALAVVLVASFGVGWYVAGRVLRPIGRISAVAREISATDLERRIDLGGPSDELRDLADTFDEMLSRLHGAFENQRQFIQEAAHELRNPLAVLRTNLDVVIADPDATPDDFRSAGEVAERAANRMSALVDDLLLYAHHQRSDVRREKVDMASLVEEIVGDFRAAAVAVSVSLEGAITGELFVTGDSGALRRAIANLLSNALRVSDPGGEVRVNTSHDSEMVWVSVVDTGPGLSVEDQAHVFERFWRGDRASAREAGRSGLGLAIVRRIVEGHGGRVTVRSTIDSGSTFTIWLPRLVEHP